MMSRFCYRRMGRRYGLQIPHTTRIGRGLYIGHFGGIIISSRSIIGNNCNIAQGVTIGETNRGVNKGSPTIGDRVWVGANAVIVGGINIGSDSLIAPLSYVNFDVPQSSVVMGNPAKIVSKNGSQGYVNNLV
jgi:serine O-acetyltransferase